MYNMKTDPYLRNIITRYYYYSGKIEKIYNNSEKAKYYFTKMDSIYNNEPIVYFETRDGYEFLVNYYKNKNDKDKQLIHINSLLRFDSINSHHKDVINRIYKEYDTPALLKEKEQLIKSLENENETLNYWINISFNFW